MTSQRVTSEPAGTPPAVGGTRRSPAPHGHQTVWSYGQFLPFRTCASRWRGVASAAPLITHALHRTETARGRHNRRAGPLFGVGYEVENAAVVDWAVP